MCESGCHEPRSEPTVGQGAFRRDLYFRLNVLTLRIPPLRTRKPDIRLLVTSFLERETQRASRAYQISVMVPGASIRIGTASSRTYADKSLSANPHRDQGLEADGANRDECAGASGRETGYSPIRVMSASSAEIRNLSDSQDLSRTYVPGPQTFQLKPNSELVLPLPLEIVGSCSLWLLFKGVA
jgi:hypothetical protein